MKIMSLDEVSLFCLRYACSERETMWCDIVWVWLVVAFGASQRQKSLLPPLQPSNIARFVLHCETVMRGFEGKWKKQIADLYWQVALLLISQTLLECTLSTRLGTNVLCAVQCGHPHSQLMTSMENCYQIMGTRSRRRVLRKHFLAFCTNAHANWVP